MKIFIVLYDFFNDTLAEWLRRWPAKPLGYARAGSNPVGVVFEIYILYFVCVIFYSFILLCIIIF